MVTLLLAASLLSPGMALAAPTTVAITATQKKDAGEKKRTGNVTEQSSTLQYTVKLTNKAFSPLSGLKAQYIIFVREDSGKGTASQQKLRREAFAADVPDIPTSGTYSFDTQGVTLAKMALDGGWSYTDGTRSVSADRPAGIWIRILQGDTVVGEYINPSTLAAKEKF